MSWWKGLQISQKCSGAVDFANSRVLSFQVSDHKEKSLQSATELSLTASNSLVPLTLAVLKRKIQFYFL